MGPGGHLWRRRRLRRERGFSRPTPRPRGGNPCRISRACSPPSELPFQNFLRVFRRQRISGFPPWQIMEMVNLRFVQINSPATDL